jgi:hypothetical protein
VVCIRVARCAPVPDAPSALATVWRTVRRAAAAVSTSGGSAAAAICAVIHGDTTDTALKKSGIVGSQSPGPKPTIPTWTGGPSTAARNSGPPLSPEQVPAVSDG